MKRSGIYLLAVVASALFAVAAHAADLDGDGVADSSDNCVDVANASQSDADGDGYGNACDGDYNNDGVVDQGDVSIFKAAFGSQVGDAAYNGNADHNDDG